MDLVTTRLGDIAANTWNPNKMPKRTWNALVSSLQTEGYVQPILCRRDDEGRLQIVDGEHRYRAMMELWGADREIEVVLLDATETRAKLNTLTMNRVRGEHVPVKEALVMADLLRSMSMADLEQRLGLPKEFIEDEIAMLGQDAPDVPEREPVVEVSIFLYRDQVEIYEHALEKALAHVKPDSTVLIGDQAKTFDAAMRKATRLAETANRARALELICANFLATADESLL